MNRIWACNNAELAEALQGWSGTTLYALDTEFVHRRTFYARPGLLQLVREQECLFIDPCAEITDWGSLAHFFNQPQRDCLIHAPREDLKLLHRLVGSTPQHFLDTQFASALLGHPVMLGLASLAKILLDVELSKTEQQLDWTRRPISESALKYACMDAAILLECWGVMQPQLADLNRLDWVRAEAQHTRTGLSENRPVSISVRVGRSPERQHCLQALAQCRMELASQRDLPQRWVVDDATLNEIAKAMPSSRSQMLELLGSKQARLAQPLLQAVSQSKQTPTPKPPLRLPQAGARLKQARKLLSEQARRLGVEEVLFCNRAQLETFAFSGKLSAPMCSGWRHEHLGVKLQQLT